MRWKGTILPNVLQSPHFLLSSALYFLVVSKPSLQRSLPPGTWDRGLVPHMGVGMQVGINDPPPPCVGILPSAQWPRWRRGAGYVCRVLANPVRDFQRGGTAAVEPIAASQ